MYNLLRLTSSITLVQAFTLAKAIRLLRNPYLPNDNSVGSQYQIEESDVWLLKTIKK